MSAAMEKVLAALRAKESQMEGGKWTCPAHNDGNPSLSVDLAEDGSVLLYCHAKCLPEQIVNGLGLEMRDLFPDSTRRHGKNARNRDEFRVPREIRYEYQDEGGEALFRVTRRYLSTGRKCFSQSVPDGQGQWRTDTGIMKGIRRVLYKLPRLLSVDKSEPVFLVEGEKDADRLESLGLVATTNPGGAGKWASCEKQGEGRFTEPLRGRDVVIIPDNDDAGLKHAQDVAKALYGSAASVKVLRLPELPDKGDVSDWLDSGKSKGDLLSLASEEDEWAPDAPMVLLREGVESNALPEIVVKKRRLREVTQDVLQALYSAAAQAQLYVRSGALVRVRRDEAQRPIIEGVTEDMLRGVIERVADCVETYKGKGVTPSTCPRDVVRDILSLGEWELPNLGGVVQVPVLRRDGSILDQPGYDAETGLLYLPSAELRVPAIPEAPCAADRDRAVALLLELLEDFPFACEENGAQSSRANAIGLMLTPSIREQVGIVPIAVVDAPQAGTGKSLLAELVGIIDNGIGGSMMTAPAREEEWSKQMTSLLAQGSTLVIIDNVEDALSSAALASTLTSEVRSDRMFGRNDVRLNCAQRATWIATGNNIRLGGDMPRRSYWIRLDAEDSRPWMREGFKHPDLRYWAREHRGELVWALLVLVRAWVAAGRPAAAVPKMGGFDKWVEMVGGILTHAGIEGFLANQEALWDEQDTETREWECFLRAWIGTFAEDAVLASDVVTELVDPEKDPDGNLREHLPQNLADSLARVGSDPKAKSGFSKRLGVALSKHLGTRYGKDGIHLERAGSDRHKGAAMWRVCRSSGSADDVAARPCAESPLFGACENVGENGLQEHPHLPQAPQRPSSEAEERESGAGPEDVGF